MEILKMSPHAYEYYKANVRGNEDISYDQACRKMTRNVQLCKEFAPEQVTKQFRKATYTYGNLKISVRGKKVISLVNHKGTASKMKIDEKRYIELSRELGIISN